MRLNERLEALALEYEEKAKAIRLTMGALNGHLTARATHDFPAKLAKAAANGNGREQPLHWTQRPENAAKVAKLGRTQRARGTHRGAMAATIRANRARSAKLLARFGEEPMTRPASIRSQLLAPLIRHGYLRNVGDGAYVRTAKEFSVTKG